MMEEKLGQELWENLKIMMGITDNHDPEGLFSQTEIERLRQIYTGAIAFSDSEH